MPDSVQKPPRAGRPAGGTRLLTALVVAVTLSLTAVMVADLLPLLREVVANVGDETELVHYIDSYGAKGVPILMGLQALQIVLAVIPSAAIQVLTGLCYGAWWGTLINIAGSIAGNLLVFVCMRQLKTLIAPFAEKLNKSKIGLGAEKLSQIRRPELLAFSFFLIPGIPNGIMPYIFAKTNITLWQYIVAIAAGSVPSTFICTFLGDRLSHGSYGTAIGVAVGAAAVVAVVLVFKNKIVALVTRKCTGEQKKD